MAYQNLYGWYTTTVIPGRFVEVEPQNISESTTPGELRANWSGHAWIDLPYVEPIPSPAPNPVVPQAVTRRQAKQALLLAGLLHEVQPAIDAIADVTQRGLMQLEWDESLNFERNRPGLIQLAGALGLNSAALDQLFITAGNLP